MRDRVTIKSIARDLGISHMTVSRALSNHPSVKDDTKQAILRRAEDLGYVRSAAAAAIRGESAPITGLLLPNIVNEFYARIANALALASDARGRQLIIHLTNDDPTREHLAIRGLREMQASGVLLVPTPGPPLADTVRHLSEMRVVQLIRQHRALPDAPRVLVNDGPSIAEAVDHLVASGHTRIGYIGGHNALSSGRDRLAAFLGAVRRNGLCLAEDLIFTAPPSVDMGRASLSAMLALAHPATAVVCGGFEISNGALESCLRRGLRLPQDLAFIGYGNPAFYEWIQGGISTIQLPVDEMASFSAGLLFSDDTAPLTETAFPTILNLRKSA
ncbi:LacI family DNA-binding transcriptional regulator [Pseudoruegeria sp. SK021]|uniref:LacI family DNA-binding transcriptional regulator n=1 Tax=Pseudoruegeria sp. SK021 TaxID=1933035 RepID=UPI000A2652B0|nr:LacI family DNA-binding transcriptional regulator [Pseudoruegeria sp. SK021]OSP53452.1 hypothetical protein BV911_17950 [Pseudoruegeria sp. SK021]